MLTERQARFVELFLRGPREVRLCATRAARAAGYAWPGKAGPRLMTMPRVAAAIRTGFNAQVERQSDAELLKLLRSVGIM